MALEQELALGVRGATSVDVRRACKSVVRGTEALLETSPDASNRHQLLAVMFEARKKLLSLENTAPNREALFETCRQLMEAPDAYAELRLEADMLLSERDLAANNATVNERVEALEALLRRHRATPAEWKSLVMGSMIAIKLLDFDLEQVIQDRMAERFGGNHEVIEYRRNRRGAEQIEVVFSGKFKRTDAAAMVFPDDRLGHNFLVIFWSRTTPDIGRRLAEVKDLQANCPAGFEVYSFNVDELPDAGGQKLRELGLDWTALHVPGGRDSSVYRAYAGLDPHALLVNAQGHVLLVPDSKGTGGGGGMLSGGYRPVARVLDDPRYLAQLRYLFSGDFLVGNGAEGRESSAAASFAADLGAIQACFTPPPFRYRLAPEDSLANYRRAETLCAAAITTYADTPDLWRVRNRRIIALLGMWNLAREPEHLEAAAEEARATLAMDLPAGAESVARFCLAKKALRDDDADPEVLLADFVADAGADKAPASALAAAAILALEAKAQTPHEQYRTRILEGRNTDDPSLWAVCALLRDRHHRYRNFHFSPGGYGYGRPQKYTFRDMVSGLGEPADRDWRVDVELRTLAGKSLRIPEDMAGKMLGILVVEPPADEAAGNNLMQRAIGFANGYASQNVDVVVAFLSDDADLVRSLVGDREGQLQIGMLPGGLKNPLVRQLGILSADRIPNPFLLRPDGTIAWSVSGLDYAAFSDNPDHAIGLGIKNNIAKVRSDVAFEALERGDFKPALELFGKSLPPEKKKDWWTAARLHGRALAYMGLKDWTAALSEIDAALVQRRADVGSGMCKCHGIVEMLLTKATVLEKLDKPRAAAEPRRLAGKETLPHSLLPVGIARQGVPVGVYYDQLKRIRMKLDY